MRLRITQILLLPCVLSLLLTACGKVLAYKNSVYVPLQLKLNYGNSEQMYSAAGDSAVKSFNAGKIRYIIRTFPVSAKYNKVGFVQEFEFIRDIEDSYDHEVTIEVLAGEYDIMVWSDLIDAESGTSCHNADDFGEIILDGRYVGNNLYRDAFRGVGTVNIPASTDSVEMELKMERPLARYEIVATDLPQFISDQTRSQAEPFNIEDYIVVIYYVGYMPDAYSVYTDKPVDSSVGSMYVSSMRMLGDTSVILGFDYVFVNDRESITTVKVGVYDSEGRQVALSKSIKVPLMRNQHTVQYGEFLTQNSSDGVNVEMEFDGSHTLII